MVSKRSFERHSGLQAAITRDFITHFTSTKIKLIYLENGAAQTLVFEKETFLDIGVTLIDFRGLPDVILLDSDKNVLFLVQAVTFGFPTPISFDRHNTLEELFKNCTANRVYVNAFPDFLTYKRFAQAIGWGTKVWIAETPEHIIHYNGNTAR